MNLKGRYDMLRQAALQLVGLPTDNVEELKAVAGQMRIVAMVDANTAVSLLLLQTLIATHPGHKPEFGTFAVKSNRSMGEFEEVLRMHHAELPLPAGWYTFSLQFQAQAGGYMLHKVTLVEGCHDVKRN